jgi:hypothetical protein
MWCAHRVAVSARTRHQLAAVMEEAAEEEVRGTGEKRMIWGMVGVVEHRPAGRLSAVVRVPVRLTIDANDRAYRGGGAYSHCSLTPLSYIVR